MEGASDNWAFSKRSVAHTYLCTPTRILGHTRAHTHTHTLSLSLTHTHTHTHTRACIQGELAATAVLCEIVEWRRKDVGKLTKVSYETRLRK
jgi:hypothetical protein